MNVIIIGNGVAGATVASKLAAKGVSVQLFSEEPVGFYSRILLPQALCDKDALQDLIAKTDPPYLQKRAATAIDPEKKLVYSGNTAFGYDKLVIATGSRSRMLDIFSCTDGACALRTFSDAQNIGETIENPVVVLGGGLLGLETALWVKRKGYEVTVLEAADRILVRQLDTEGASILKAHLETQGLVIKEGVKTQAQKLDLGGHIRALVTEGEEEVPCRTLLLSLGVLPEITLAKAAGLKTNRGIVVDQYLQTSNSDILAIGDCAEYEGQVPGIIPVALAMAETAAANLSGEHKSYQTPVLFTRFKGDGLDVVSVGSIEGPAMKKRAGNRYEAYFVQDGKLKGAILVGSTEHLAFVRSKYNGSVSDADIEALLKF
ncbi:MAG: FAD-dependent oxidoreductase [Sphaerochaeta associata]|uniref:NAD(P)/FAD-dependent oxidoreductase n=1 Tax=Sphaerochaeta associata TaxID=1129264 RepID=UPI002B20D6D3|nr:FAD-dependent oxidoreductase [Sphaerochaeta associata]MEA5107912.1 FAD-dependent oxidoreductase [Sphaerochaeta associata]